MLFVNFQIIKIYVDKCLEKWCLEIIKPKLNDTQSGFRPGRSITDQIFTLHLIFEKSWEYAKDASTHALSTLTNHLIDFLVKSFEECCGCTVHPAWLLGRQHMHTFWRWRLAGQRCTCWRDVAQGTDTCGTPFLRRRNLLHWSFPVVRVKLRFVTISMIKWTMCLSSSNRSSLKVRPRGHAVW